MIEKHIRNILLALQSVLNKVCRIIIVKAKSVPKSEDFMKNYVTAEFDSVDLADLASGRVRNIPGVSGIQVLGNRIAEKSAKNDKGLFASPVVPVVSGLSYPGVMGFGSFYNLPTPFSFNVSGNEEYEPAERRDALLSVEMETDNNVTKVSSILRNVGGRNVRLVRK
jgi:hypothetical protein